MSENRKTVPTRDYYAVVAAVQTYVDGLQTGDPDGTVKAFDNDARMYGFANGDFFGGPANTLHGFVADYGISANLAARVDILAITPTTAVVRIDMEHALGNDYTDFHLLVKHDDSWKIVAKSYHQYGS